MDAKTDELGRWKRRALEEAMRYVYHKQAEEVII